MKLNKQVSVFLKTNLTNILCILFVIGVLIYLIVRVKNNQENYSNNHTHLHNTKETFKNGTYDSHKCDIDMRGLQKDDLYDKVKNIDIVYMWVDGSDNNWQKSMKSNVSSRNRNNNEIIYSLRSISKFMSWHKGRIFIVTPNQTPQGLNAIQGTDEQTIRNAPKNSVIIIDQKTIMPEEIGETMNSFMIEVFLHRIPTLSEDFIYMNDDYFMGKHIIPTDFYSLNKDGSLKPKFYSNNYKINGGIKQSNDFFKKKRKLWLSATYYTNGTLTKYFKDQNERNNKRNNTNNEYKQPERFYLEHAPYMFKKSWCEDVYQIWKPEFKKMYEHKRRHWHDLIFVLIYRYYCLESGKPCDLVKEPENIFLKLITNNNKENVKFYEKVVNKCPKFFTLNDEYSKEYIKGDMTDFMEEFYNNKGRFEQ
jgi:hypothetical protein